MTDRPYTAADVEAARQALAQARYGGHDDIVGLYDETVADMVRVVLDHLAEQGRLLPDSSHE